MIEMAIASHTALLHFRKVSDRSCEPRLLQVSAPFDERPGCVERGFGGLKHERGMLPLRVRRIERCRLHMDLSTWPN